MVVKEVKNLCFDLLKEKLVPLGYKPLKGKFEFTKINDLGFDRIWFGSVEYAALKTYKIYIYLTIRVDAIEELKVLYPEFYDVSQGYKHPTCNVNCGSFIGNPNLEFVIKAPEDVQNAVDTFWNIYNEHIIEHIPKCYDVDFLNALYPKYGKDCNDWLTASDWFISVPTLAYLANKETFPAFRKAYMDYLKNELNFPEDMLQELNEYMDTISKK